jgi:hypothetical protein
MSCLSTQKSTTASVIAAYNAWNIDAILAFRAPDCIQQILPHSLNRAPQTNAEYRERFSVLMPLFENFTVRAYFPYPLSIDTTAMTERNN